MKTEAIKGADVRVGDKVLLQDGTPVTILDMQPAPMTIQYANGKRAQRPMWASLSGMNGHTTICADDDVIVVARPA